MKFCVVGAGIIGLSTALELQKQFPNASITIIAEKFNQNTTSDGAAGLIMPATHFRGPTIEISKQWIKDSFKYYKNLMENTNAGVVPVSGYILSNTSQNLCENEFMQMVTSDFRPVTDLELEQLNGNFKYGTYMTSMVAPCRKLLPWFLQKFLENRGIVVNYKLHNFQSLGHSYNVVFNCCGLGAIELCLDNEVVPIRGQILQVEAPLIKNFYVMDAITYAIPCGYDNLVTLGGTQDFGLFDNEIDNYITQSIMDRCCKFNSDLRTAPIVRKWVGHRPYRSKVRAEIEIKNGLKIIHNYGHGGYGVTTGPGSAIYVVELFRANHSSSMNKCRL